MIPGETRPSEEEEEEERHLISSHLIVYRYSSFCVVSLRGRKKSRGKKGQRLEGGKGQSRRGGIRSNGDADGGTAKVSKTSSL